MPLLVRMQTKIDKQAWNPLKLDELEAFLEVDVP